MTKTWLIVNEASGSYDAAVIADIVTWFAQSDQPVDCIVRCPDEDLPDPGKLVANGVDLLAIYAGDGTTNSALKTASGWDGAVLILPGGTMNLLARALHGEQSCQSIIGEAARNRRTVQLNTVEIGESTAYVGVIAGPTTSLAQVRENARHARLSELVLEAIPAAISDSLAGPQVGIKGHDDRFPAIFAAPRDDSMALCGFTASTIGEVLSHAGAWLNGDFRDGPRVDLGSASTATLVSEADEIGLLIDGEQAKAVPGDVLRLARAPHHFVETRPSAAP
ncbi:diacylglycerol kinase family enzyme [Blastomonas natatoria]|uniref:Diacylglycerol kinase family enzyme n=1 Tax=Blastomonas natatoria TaxID=34015 RepID=A0A2V3V2R5_9SPHN|nr:diacylglycerol kinase family protein [Blastomonas natatoria]PXW74525.1 diacylglycerol kinase family enzyme [Blastomonas natatoria]